MSLESNLENRLFLTLHPAATRVQKVLSLPDHLKCFGVACASHQIADMRHKWLTAIIDFWDISESLQNMRNVLISHLKREREKYPHTDNNRLFVPFIKLFIFRTFRTTTHCHFDEIHTKAPRKREENGDTEGAADWRYLPVMLINWAKYLIMQPVPLQKKQEQKAKVKTKKSQAKLVMYMQKETVEMWGNWSLP